MELEGKKVFVAGGTGMAGAHIISCLLQEHPRVKITASAFNTKPFIKDKRISFVRGDLRKLQDTSKMMNGADLVVMAAARTANAYTSRRDSASLMNDNLLMNTSVLSACASEKVKRLVIVGSSVLYQDASRPLKEKDLDLNIDPHPVYFGLGWVTRFIEKIASEWHRQTGIPVAMVRAANIYGPYSKFGALTSNFIPALIRKAVEKKDPFEVWGSPEAARDVVYAEDFARAVADLLKKDAVRCDVFNIGSGRKTTVGEVVRTVLECSGHSPKKIMYNGRKPVTMKVRLLDCSKIMKVTGWAPRVTLNKGIAETVEWWRQNKGGWIK